MDEKYLFFCDNVYLQIFTPYQFWLNWKPFDEFECLQKVSNISGFSFSFNISLTKTVKENVFTITNNTLREYPVSNVHDLTVVGWNFYSIRPSNRLKYWKSFSMSKVHAEMSFL